MDWAALRNELEVRVKPIAKAVGDAVHNAGLSFADFGPVQQFLASNARQPSTPNAATSSVTSTLTARMASVTTIDLLTLATSLPYASQISSFSTELANVTFQQYDNSFSNILGPNASWRMISNQSYEAFHEAGVYHQETNSLYISSNWAGDFSNPINVSILSLEDYSLTSQRYDGLFAPNGGTAYVTPGTNEKPQIVFCEEGSFELPSGLTIVDPVTKTTKVRGGTLIIDAQSNLRIASGQ